MLPSWATVKCPCHSISCVRTVRRNLVRNSGERRRGRSRITPQLAPTPLRNANSPKSLSNVTRLDCLSLPSQVRIRHPSRVMCLSPRSIDSSLLSRMHGGAGYVFVRQELRHHSYRERVDSMLFHRFTGIAERRLNVFGHKLRIIRQDLPGVHPSARRSRMNSTAIRVPLITGFPTNGSVNQDSILPLHYRSPINASILRCLRVDHCVAVHSADTTSSIIMVRNVEKNTASARTGSLEATRRMVHRNCFTAYSHPSDIEWGVPGRIRYPFHVFAAASIAAPRQ